MSSLITELWDVSRHRLVIVIVAVALAVNALVGSAGGTATSAPNPGSTPISPRQDRADQGPVRVADEEEPDQPGIRIDVVDPHTRSPASPQSPSLIWDGCQMPISVAFIDNGLGPRNAIQLVEIGIAKIGGATGFAFDSPVVIGMNYESPDDYDLTVKFVPRTHPAFGGDSSIAGVSRTWISGSVIRRADIWINVDSDLDPDFGPGPTIGNVILHELGHAVGLDHTPDPASIMTPSMGPLQTDGYTQSDLAGLEALGAAAHCGSSTGSDR